MMQLSSCGVASILKIFIFDFVLLLRLQESNFHPEGSNKG